MAADTPKRRVPSISRRLVGVVALVLLVTPACSSEESSKERAAGGSAASTATTEPAECRQGASVDDIVVEPVDGVPSDLTLASFDGTQIRTHWFPAPGASLATPAPTILMGPGWSLAGDTSADGDALFGALSIGKMNETGYNVLTWDPRGFGESGGTAEVDDDKFEGRDVQVLIDWVAAQPAAQTDRDDDPRLGMVGFSYGGGIQLTTAAIDCRVDAIVPGLAWHSLQSSLYKNDTVKAGWAGILSDTASGGSLDPHITSAAKSGLSTGLLSKENRDWFISRGPGDDVAAITAPTLFVQGTVDTLFTLDEAITNYRILRDKGVTTAMLWFCGGHGTCLSDEASTDQVTAATYAWLGRYLKGDATVDTGPRLDVVDQTGARWTADDYPTGSQKPLTAKGEGTLQLSADSVAGPAAGRPGAADVLTGLVLPITPAKAAVSVDVAVDTPTIDGVALGAPKLSLDYSGTSPAGVEPTRVFAQLVDDTTGLVVGNQITPVKVVLDGKDHTTDVDLEVIAQRIQPGARLTLQLVATTPAYATPRLGGDITFESIDLTIPMAAGLQPVAAPTLPAGAP